MVVRLRVLSQSKSCGVGIAGGVAAAERYATFHSLTVLFLVHRVHVPGECRPRPARPAAAARRPTRCREDEKQVDTCSYDMSQEP